MFSQVCVKSSVNKGVSARGMTDRRMSAKGSVASRDGMHPGDSLPPGGLHPSWCLPPGGGQITRTTGYGRQVGGTHPTKMCFCFHTISFFCVNNTSTNFNYVTFCFLTPDDVGHPDSIFISLDHNPFHCDSRMCWIKQGVQDGWLSLQYPSSIVEPDHWYPDCTNYPDESWDDVYLECDAE